MLLRYVPDVVRGEGVNFGVVLVEEGWPERGGAHVRLAPEREWERLERMSPQADVEVLRALGEELATDFTLGTATREGTVVRGELLRKYEDMFSNNVQLSERRGLMAESPVAELEGLARMYLEHSVPSRGRLGQSGRAAILERMRLEFEARQVWRLFKKGIAVADYAGRPGLGRSKDPLKIDCGYAVPGTAEFKMYHALSLSDRGDANGAKALAYSYPRLRAGMLEREQRETQLTAIVGEDVDRTGDEVQFALEALEEAEIRVEDVSALPRIAQMAAEMLRV
jgi:hypothetical protein